MRAVNRAPRRRRQRGQALAELAIVMPIIMVLLLGTAQVGAILYGQITVDTAAREGARAASYNPDTSGVYSAGGSGEHGHLSGSADKQPGVQRRRER